MAGTKDIIIEKGATFIIEFTWSTRDTAGIKTPVDLTGYSAECQARESYDSNALIFNLVSPTDITLSNLGVIVIKISSTITKELNKPKGVWDLLLTAPSGDKIRLLEGKVTIKDGATR